MRSALFVAIVAALAVGCKDDGGGFNWNQSGDDDDGDGGSADGDADTDADADSDADADADADGDTDGDTDSDSDGDTDADADSDADTDGDTDADTDADTDTDADCSFLSYAFDFEAGVQGFTHGPSPGTTSQDPWALGTDATFGCHASTSCFGTNIEGDYAICRSAELVTPVMDLSPCRNTGHAVLFSFWHDFDFEPYTDSRWWDGGMIQISGDGGSTWEDVTPSQAYQGLINGSYATNCSFTGEVNGHQGWSGTNPLGDWTQVTVPIPNADLTADFKVRFVFSSDEMVPADGWAIDDVEVIIQ